MSIRLLPLQRVALQLQRSVSSHFLRQAHSVLEQPGPQHFVALHQAAKRPLQRVDLERTRDLEQCRHVIRARVGVQLVQHPHPLLRVARRQPFLP